MNLGGGFFWFFFCLRPRFLKDQTRFPGIDQGLSGEDSQRQWSALPFVSQRATGVTLVARHGASARPAKDTGLSWVMRGAPALQPAPALHRTGGGRPATSSLELMGARNPGGTRLQPRPAGTPRQ